MNIQIIKSYRNTNPEPMRVINRWPEIKKQLEAKKIPILQRQREGFWKRYRAMEPEMKDTEYKRIERKAMALFNINYAELTGKRRSDPIARARWFVMYWATKKIGYSSPQIARRMGCDNSTVFFGLRRYPEYRAEMGRTLRAIR